MLKVNLLPKNNLDKQPVGKFLRWTLSYGRYIIISVELVVFLVFFSRFIYDQELANINDEIEQRQAIVAAASEFEEQFITIQKKIEEIKKLDDNRGIYLDTLNRLEIITPVDVTYTKLTFNLETITITGEASTNESFAKLLSSLKSDDSFSEITIQNLGKKKSINPQSNSEPESIPIVFAINTKLSRYPTPTPIATVNENETVTQEE